MPSAHDLYPGLDTPRILIDLDVDRNAAAMFVPPRTGGGGGRYD